jgi:hypothetical protein
MAALGPCTVGWLIILAAWGIAAGWVRAWRGTQKRLARAPEYYLALEPEGLHMALETGSVWVPWEDVTAVEVDEERLVVVVHRRGARPLQVPPVWRDAGLEEIRSALEGAVRSPG